MVHNTADIPDAGASLSRRLTKRRLLRKKAIGKPRLGAAKLEFGEFVIPDSFFEPLPNEILKALSGK